ALGELVRSRRVDALPPGSEGIILAHAVADSRSSTRRPAAASAYVGRLAYMAGQAQGRIRVVHHQEILGHRVNALNVRIVTAVALHVALNQLHCRVAGGAAAQT